MKETHSLIENYNINDDDDRAQMFALLSNIRLQLPLNRGIIYEGLKIVEISNDYDPAEIGASFTCEYKQIKPSYGTGFQHGPIPENRTYIIELSGTKVIHYEIAGAKKGLIKDETFTEAHDYYADEHTKYTINHDHEECIKEIIAKYGYRAACDVHNAIASDIPELNLQQMNPNAFGE